MSDFVPTGYVPRCVDQLREHGMDLPPAVYAAARAEPSYRLWLKPTSSKCVQEEAEPPSLELHPGIEIAPMSVGTGGAWSVTAAGVELVHLYIYFDGQTLLPAERRDEGAAHDGRQAHSGGLDRRRWALRHHLRKRSLSSAPPTSRPPSTKSTTTTRRPWPRRLKPFERSRPRRRPPGPPLVRCPRWPRPLGHSSQAPSAPRRTAIRPACRPLEDSEDSTRAHRSTGPWRRCVPPQVRHGIASRMSRLLPTWPRCPAADVISRASTGS